MLPLLLGVAVGVVAFEVAAVVTSTTLCAGGKHNGYGRKKVAGGVTEGVTSSCFGFGDGSGGGHEGGGGDGGGGGGGGD